VSLSGKNPFLGTEPEEGVLIGLGHVNSRYGDAELPFLKAVEKLLLLVRGQLLPPPNVDFVLPLLFEIGCLWSDRPLF